MVPEINLLPQMERKSAGNRWVALLLGIAFILIVLFLAFQYFSLTKSVNALQVDQQTLLANRTSIEANITALEQALEEEERTTESFDVVERFTNRFTVTFDPSYLRSGGAVR